MPLAIGHWGPWLLAPAGGEFDPGPYAYTYIHMYMFLHICTHTHTLLGTGRLGMAALSAA